MSHYQYPDRVTVHVGSDMAGAPKIEVCTVLGTAEGWLEPGDGWLRVRVDRGPRMGDHLLVPENRCRLAVGQ